MKYVISLLKKEMSTKHKNICEYNKHIENKKLSGMERSTYKSKRRIASKRCIELKEAINILKLRL